MSNLSPTQQLAAAEIAIYGVLLFITGFIAFKHGLKGMMVWQMLIGLEAMVIIYAALHIAQDGNPRLYGAGVSFANSGILALLVLVPIGLIYEVCLFIPTIGLWTNRLNLGLFHAIPMVGIVMGTVGGAPKDHSDTGDHSPANPVAAKTGWVMLLLCLIIFLAEGTYLLLFRVRQATSYRVSKQLKTLLYTLTASLPFSMIRLGHEVSFIFDPSMDRNLEVGTFTTIFFVAFLMPLAAVIPLVFGGFLTRNINTADRDAIRGESRNAFRMESEPKDSREEAEQQHNRRPEAIWML